MIDDQIVIVPKPPSPFGTQDIPGLELYYVDSQALTPEESLDGEENSDAIPVVVADGSQILFETLQATPQCKTQIRDTSDENHSLNKFNDYV